MAKIEKIGNIQVIDNKEDMFFYFPMISMACTGSGYKETFIDSWLKAFMKVLFVLGWNITETFMDQRKKKGLDAVN